MFPILSKAICHFSDTTFGCMGFDDPPFGHEIYRLLKHHLGRSTKEIGDLDLSYTL
jgi:hypothetical protein